MKFEINDLKYSGIILKYKSYDCLIQLGNISLKKKTRKINHSVIKIKMHYVEKDISNQKESSLFK